MNIPIHTVPTLKLPAISKIVNEVTTKLPCPSRCVAASEAKQAGQYDENKLLARVARERREPRFSWRFPVALFVAALMFWSLVAWIIAANFFAIERSLTFW